ncbi:MAG: hypothetical protein IMW93_05195 [Thermoanaerobacteraceae bacterium]|nr:hypothetical protein [Thermoanaerobacteraceae bacterium]
MAELKTGQTKLEKDMAGLKDDVATLKTGQAKLEKDVAGLKDDVAALESRIENEVNEMLRALFDGWKLHDQKLNALTDTVDKIAQNVEFLVLRVTRLEQLAR